MRKVVVISVVSLLSWISVVGQGVVKGKITNELNEPVIAASVYLESNESYGVYSDTDGNYEIELPHNTPQRVVVSYLGYSNQTFEVTVKKGQVYLKNIKLVPSQQALNTVVVTGKANLSNDMALEKMRMKTAASIDYISAATISKTGDANVIAAVSRVSGVSTYGGFITVRGIGDRYIRTTINGMSIPTLDPFTNNIKLDMFPTSLINNVIITKTYSADLPGDWAGAFLSVETKTNPNKLIASYESSYGYNSQTTFKEILTTQKSKTDWLGYDNGFREYDHDSFVNAKMKPETYDQFVALGLGDYFSSIGVTD
ncbi:MAG TPA: carboxypeptidase-like regulatory domain-containing protein, partial [Bacteroidales bacterium]|nr:carboxypeptidase-like regulatory domain-containing protein [Bacteroidales bacterium]